MSSPASDVKDILLKAGAGAGKTTTLVQVFLDFTKKFNEKNKKNPRIVVTTFTRKATQELKERLLKKALEENREDLFHFISSRSSVQISTIHGILNLFLSRYGVKLGLTPDYKLLSESEVRNSVRRILRQIILAKPHLHELLEEYDFKDLEIYLLRYFNESQVHPDLKFASTEDFAQEVARVAARLSETGRSLAQRILAETDREDWIQYLAGLQGINFKNQESVRNFSELSTKPRFMKKNPPFSENLNEELEIFRKQMDAFSEKICYTPAYWDLHQKNAQLFHELAVGFKREFEKQKLENGLLSLSDLEILSYRLAQEHPESAQAFSEEWDFWMIDEYQDTSPIQVRLMRALIGERPSFIVGDPQQSIYLFRGARSEVFLEKMEEVRIKGGDLQEKMINYRSNPSVLRFINHYFTRLDSQFGPMEVDESKKDSTRPQDLQIILTQESEETDQQEQLATIARIQELIHEGVSPEKICVLARTHRTLSQTARLAHEFGISVQLHSGSGFFARVEVQDSLNFLKFLVNPHDNFSFVALLRSPWFHLGDQEILEFCHDRRHSFWREAQSFLPRVDEKHPLCVLKKYLLLAETQGLAWTVKRALIDLGYVDYSSTLDPSGRREANLWKVVALLSQEERRPGFNFLDFIESGLDQLSTEMGGEDADATPVIEPKRVNFMTVHASKGLQFDYVIVPALGKNPDTRKEANWYLHEASRLWTLPVREADSQKMVQSLLAEKIHEEMLVREQAEFNRVLYVALTRAKCGITLLVDQIPEKKSWAALCPLDLSPGEHVEDDFIYLVRRENLIPQKVQAEKLPLAQVRPLWQEESKAESRKNRTISVTELISSHAVAGTSRSQELWSSLKRAQQGTEAHRVFESLKYVEAASLREDLSVPLQNALDYICRLEEIPLLKIIRQGFVEWGFAYQQGSALLQGQIDLWGMVEKTAWIVDYKTGSQKYAEAAFAQMEIYAWALRKMGRISADAAIKLAVIYPLEQKNKIRELKNFTDLEKRIKDYFAD